MAEYFAMGGYGGYIWVGYGFSLIVLDLLIIKTILDSVRIRKELPC